MNPLGGWLLATGILVVLAMGFLVLVLVVRRHYRRCLGCPLCLPR